MPGPRGRLGGGGEQCRDWEGDVGGSSTGDQGGDAREKQHR